MKAIYPGSFDPITYGHFDIIDRASKIFDELVIAIMANSEKSGMFTFEERKKMCEEVVKDYPNVSVVVGHGMTVDFAREVGANVLIRGIRAVSDYEYEMQLATANMLIAEDIHTVFLMARPEFSFLSSSTAKEIAKYHGPLEAFVPPIVQEKMEEKYR